MNCDIFLVGLGRRRSLRPPNVPARGLRRRRAFNKSVSRSLPDLRPLLLQFPQRPLAHAGFPAALRQVNWRQATLRGRDAPWTHEAMTSFE